MCEKCDIEPVICFNKSDLDEGKDIINIYKKTGYRIFKTSVYDNKGIENLKGIIEKGITAVAGFSGVGKSSLLNSLTESDISGPAVSAKNF